MFFFKESLPPAMNYSMLSLFYLFIYFWWSCTISKTGEKIQVKNNPAETKPRSFPCLFPFSKQSYKICISVTDGAVKNAMCKVWHVMKDHMMMLLPKRQMNPHLCMALRFLKDSSASFFFFFSFVSCCWLEVLFP